MKWRERVSVSIPCFGIRFSAVLYITNAPSIQMIQQLLGSPVVYQFYDMRFFVREALFPPVLHNFLPVHNLLPQSTLIFWRKLCNTGGTVSYKKKLKSLYERAHGKTSLTEKLHIFRLAQNFVSDSWKIPN